MNLPSQEKARQDLVKHVLCGLSSGVPLQGGTGKKAGQAWTRTLLQLNGTCQKQTERCHDNYELDWILSTHCWAELHALQEQMERNSDSEKLWHGEVLSSAPGSLYKAEYISRPLKKVQTEEALSDFTLGWLEYNLSNSNIYTYIHTHTNTHILRLGSNFGLIIMVFSVLIKWLCL